MSIWHRIFARRGATGPRVRPESVRSILVLADEGTEPPPGDPMELVMRVFHAKNRAMFAAVLQRDLWPLIQLGFGAFAAGERTDPRRLAEFVRKSHGPELTACAQLVRHPLSAARAPSDLTLLTVHHLGQGQSAPERIEPSADAIVPLLDLTSPLAGRDR